MALNFSCCPIFPAHCSEDNFVSPSRIADGHFVEEVLENNGDAFANPWHTVREVDECFDYGRDINDRCGSQDSVPKDIIDLLPADPFGMDISSTFTAITGWLEDLELGYSGYGIHDIGPSATDYEIFAGLNFIWNKAMEFQNFPGNSGCNDKHDASCNGNTLGNVLCNSISGSGCNEDSILSVDNENAATVYQRPQEFPTACCDGDAETPHAAFSFALGYLGVRELLSVERVCKSLHSTVQNDPLLWRSIHIDQPLNDKITDDTLLQLTSRAQGNLQCLSLVQCQRITDVGLRRVIESNPRMAKLSVPACIRLSIDGVVSSMKAMKDIGTPGIKHLRIGGIFGVTESHFEELKILLGIDSGMQHNVVKPHFFQRGQLYISCEDDRAIDIEMCPKCQNLRLVYDCPAEGCQGKEQATTQECRGCKLCVARCVQCGRCIDDVVYEETFYFETLCSGCSDSS